MRWVLVCAALLAVSGCEVRSVTKQDRIAVSNAMAKRPAGTQVTDRELAMADQDKTVVCEDTMVVGSHIPTRRCRTMRQIEEEKKAYEAKKTANGCYGGVDMTGAANAQRVACVGN